MSEGIVRERLSGHWYTADAKPCHTVVGKNGKERSTTLRDARQMGLFPSVTTILKTLAAPQLTRWLVENAIIAAVTTERRDDEDETAFAKRIAEEAGEVAGNAADFGTRFHAMMEDLLTGNTDPAVDDDLLPYLPFAREWIEGNVAEVISAEQVIVGDGYAGTADLLAVTHDGAKVLFDFKTKSLNRGNDGEWKVPKNPTTHGRTNSQPTARCLEPTRSVTSSSIRTSRGRSTTSTTRKRRGLTRGKFSRESETCGN